MRHIPSTCLCTLLFSALFSCLNELRPGGSSAVLSISMEDDFFDAIRDNDVARVTDLLNQDNSLLGNIVARDNGEGEMKERTPLMYAAQLGNQPMVSLLLEQGAQVNQANSEGDTPFITATQEGHLGVVEYLKKIEFIQAIREGNLEKVRKVVEEEGVDIINNFYSTGSDERFTPLQIAALNGKNSIVKFFVSHDNTSIDTRTEQGNFTALHLAVKKNQRDVVKTLIEFGANKNAQSNEGMTPLHIAAKKGFRRTAEILIDQGVGIHVSNREGATAVYLAHQGGHQRIEERLLAQGAKLEITDNITGTGRRNNDGTTGSGRRNDDGPTGTGRRNDDGPTGTGRRNDDGTTGSGRRNDDGTTSTGRRNDDGTTGSGRRNDDGTTGSGRRNDDGTSI